MEHRQTRIPRRVTPEAAAALKANDRIRKQLHDRRDALKRDLEKVERQGQALAARIEELGLAIEQLDHVLDEDV